MTRAPVSYFITTITEGRFTTSLHHDIVYCIQRSVYILLDDRYRVRVSLFCMSAYLMLIFFSCSRCQLGCSTNPLTLLYISDLPATHQENGRRYHIYQLGWVLTSASCVGTRHHCSPSRMEEATRERGTKLR